MKPIQGFIRHILTFIGGYLIASGKLAEADAQTIIAGLTTLFGVIWSIYDKKPEFLNSKDKTSFLPFILLPFLVVSMMTIPVGCVTGPDGQRTISPIVGNLLKETMKAATMVGLSKVAGSVNELNEFTPSLMRSIESVYASTDDPKEIGTKLRDLFSGVAIQIGNAEIEDLLYNEIYGELIGDVPNSGPEGAEEYRQNKEFLDALKG